MDNLTKSVTDIIEDMREHVQAVRDYPRDIDVTENDVEQWADRLEEAEEREAKEWNALRVKVADFENTKARLAKLKDIVKRLLPIIENGYDEAKAYGKAVKALCVLKDVDPGEVDKVLKGWEDLIHEAKEVAE